VLRADGIWLVDPDKLYDALVKKSGMPVDVTAVEEPGSAMVKEID
jgi:hypothetical protein